MAPEDIIFDPNILTVATGMEEMAKKFHDLGGEILVPVAPAE